MRQALKFCAALALAASLAAQEEKPVPKDSIRVAVTGCSRNYIFTAGRPAEDRPGGSIVPEGTRLRMNGSKKLMADIKGQEGSTIEITGLVLRGQFDNAGVSIGRGIRVRPGGGSGGIPSPGAGQVMIDVEGWRRVPGECAR
jgi:hypothetical protein